MQQLLNTGATTFNWNAKFGKYTADSRDISQLRLCHKS